MVLQAFLDDSGSDWQSPHFVLAGYVASVPEWDSFANKWEAVLKQPPVLKYFKASEAQSLRRDGQYAGWSEAARDARIESLVGIICKTVANRVHVVYPQPLYDAYVKGRVPEPFDSPYFLCLLGAVERIVRPLHQFYPTVEGKIDFIFDEQQKLRRMAEALFDGFKESGISYAHLIGKISHEDDEEFFPLQAADLNAWLIRRALERPQEEPRSCFQPLAHIPLIAHTITEHDVKRYMSGFWGNFSSITTEIYERRQAIAEMFRAILLPPNDEA